VCTITHILSYTHTDACKLLVKLLQKFGNLCLLLGQSNIHMYMTHMTTFSVQHLFNWAFTISLSLNYHDTEPKISKFLKSTLHRQEINVRTWSDMSGQTQVLALHVMYTTLTLCTQLVKKSKHLILTKLSTATAVEIRVRNRSAIFLKIGHFVGYWLSSHWKCTVKLADQNGFWSAKCWKMANGQLLRISSTAMLLYILACSLQYAKHWQLRMWLHSTASFP